MSNAELDDQWISFFEGILKKLSKGTILYIWVSSSMDTAGILGFNTRQSARFDSVAHACVARWHSTRTRRFHRPKLEVYRVYCQETGRLAKQREMLPQWSGCNRFIEICGFGGLAFFTHASRTALKRGTHGKSQTTRAFLCLWG